MIKERLAEILAELRQYIEELYGARLVQIILYGSQARGDAQPDSDIDILIVLQDPVDFVAEVKRTNYFIANLCLEHNVVIASAFVGKERFQQENSGFFRNVRREGIVVSCSSFKLDCQELQNACSATILVATDTQFKCVTAYDTCTTSVTTKSC